jgi:hypothetical protein
VYVFFNIHADSVNLAFSDKDGDIEVSASREDSRKIAQTLAQALAPANPLIDKSDRELLYEFTKFSVA